MAAEGEFPKSDGDVLYASEVNSFQTDKVTSVIAGGGIDVSGATGDVTISGENATTSNKGIASFNSDDFNTSAGAVSLKNKTSYWSAAGCDFLPGDESDSYVRNTTDQVFECNSSITQISLPVHLPHGAVVTAVIVYGNDSGETWFLVRNSIASSVAGEQMATASINTEDTTITNSTINNSTHKYNIIIQNLDSADEIRGARITYTTDYD